MGGNHRRILVVNGAPVSGVTVDAVTTTSANMTWITPCFRVPPVPSVQTPPYCLCAARISVARALAAACRRGAYHPRVEVLPPVSCQPNSGLPEGLGQAIEAGGVFRPHLRPVQVQLFRHQLRQAGQDALPHSDEPRTNVTMLPASILIWAPIVPEPGMLAALAALGAKANGTTRAEAPPASTSRRDTPSAEIFHHGSPYVKGQGRLQRSGGILDPGISAADTQIAQFGCDIDSMVARLHGTRSGNQHTRLAIAACGT